MANCQTNCILIEVCFRNNCKCARTQVLCYFAMIQLLLRSNLVLESAKPELHLSKHLLYQFSAVLNRVQSHRSQVQPVFVSVDFAAS